MNHWYLKKKNPINVNQRDFFEIHTTVNKITCGFQSNNTISLSRTTAWRWGNIFGCVCYRIQSMFFLFILRIGKIKHLYGVCCINEQLPMFPCGFQPLWRSFHNRRRDLTIYQLTGGKSLYDWIIMPHVGWLRAQELYRKSKKTPLGNQVRKNPVEKTLPTSLHQWLIKRGF